MSQKSTNKPDVEAVCPSCYQAWPNPRAIPVKEGETDYNVAPFQEDLETLQYALTEVVDAIVDFCKSQQQPLPAWFPALKVDMDRVDALINEMDLREFEDEEDDDANY